MRNNRWNALRGARVSSEIGDASKISRSSLSILTKLYVLSFSAAEKHRDTVKLHLSDTIGGQDVSDN